MNFFIKMKSVLFQLKKIKALVDDKSQYTDWSNGNNIKSQLKMELVILLYEKGYSPKWNDEIFNMVMEQAENFKANVQQIIRD